MQMQAENWETSLARVLHPRVFVYTHYGITCNVLMSIFYLCFIGITLCSCRQKTWSLHQLGVSTREWHKKPGLSLGNAAREILGAPTPGVLHCAYVFVWKSILISVFFIFNILYLKLCTCNGVTRDIGEILRHTLLDRGEWRAL